MRVRDDAREVEGDRLMRIENGKGSRVLLRSGRGLARMYHGTGRGPTGSVETLALAVKMEVILGVPR